MSLIENIAIPITKLLTAIIFDNMGKLVITLKTCKQCIKFD